MLFFSTNLIQKRHEIILPLPHHKILECKQKLGANKYGLHQVVYASFETRLEARKALQNIKSTHNTSAWLLAKKLD